MSLTSVYLAEEVLALPADQRRALAQLLLESVTHDGRSDDDIRATLNQRLDDLKAGRDPGLNFEEVFGEKE